MIKDHFTAQKSQEVPIMKMEDVIAKMSKESKQRLAACKTQEEAQEIMAEEFGGPLDDEVLDAITGGWDAHIFDDSRHIYPQGGKPSVIC